MPTYAPFWPSNSVVYLLTFANMYRNDVKREDLAIPKPPLSLFKFKVSGNPATLGEN